MSKALHPSTLRNTIAKIGLLAILGLLAPPSAHAHEIMAGDIHIHHPHVIEPAELLPAELSVSMTLHNVGAADELISAECPIAKSVTFARNRGASLVADGAAIALPNGEAVVIGKLDRMILLGNVTEALTGYQYFPMTLHFKVAGAVKIEVYVGDETETMDDTEHEPKHTH